MEPRFSGPSRLASALPARLGPIAAFPFTIGRGNETVVKACEVLSRYIHGLTLADVIGDFNKIWRQLTNDDQLVWIGPEKGPVHQAAAGILNALWCGRRHFIPPPPFKFPL